ncbi:nicotinamide riboside kinase 1 [Malacosoma neustria nucleopolyhedrovirus]|uniref:nicotinamide riboside kinase 1 n=1 Tax=Malacosoma neustria nuclear polyhedrosis virus TaxID=38012 RepID=UPI000E35F4AD|nr:nicotinamide riboside kinase 1 [Malacosoma neustria nucleopolyhedrovirus]AUF81622.1 nicotinamide riboside kinase 1 [Malacosoma neustria nucleopolyhedrovirus]
MSHLLALSGVACAVKSRILKRLEKFYENETIVVHYNDYTKISDFYSLDATVGEILYAAYRCKDEESFKKDFNYAHIFDCTPLEQSLVMKSVRDDYTLCKSETIYKQCKEMGLCEGWKSIVLNVEKNVEKQLSGSSPCLHNVYNEKIEKYFKIWTCVMQFQSYTIGGNCKETLDDHENNIVKLIHDTLYKWRDNNDGLMVYEYRMPLFRSKIASFDLDDTLITTKNNLSFSKAPLEWQFKYNNVKEKFIELLDKDYCIMIVLNTTITTLRDEDTLKKAIESICRALNLPLVVYVSTKFNKYRKPNTGIFENLVAGKYLINFKKSFHCGDNDNGTSRADSKFATNCNVNFFYDFDVFE